MIPDRESYIYHGSGKLPVTIYGKEYGSKMRLQQLEMRADAATGCKSDYYTSTII